MWHSGSTGGEMQLMTTPHGSPAGAILFTLGFAVGTFPEDIMDAFGDKRSIAAAVLDAFDRHFNLSRTMRPGLGLLGTIFLLWCFSVGFHVRSL